MIGINGGWGESNGRVVGDMSADKEGSAQWVNFNDLGHNSAGMDDHYEIAIPLSELGTTADHTKSTVSALNWQPPSAFPQWIRCRMTWR